MKKHRRIQREFDQIKKTLRRTEQIVNSTKDKKLWDHEASLRKKIKALRGMQWAELDGYEDVLQGYIDLLDTVSARLLNHYNKQKGTNYTFEEVVAEDRRGYLQSGIISVLVTHHIPRRVRQEMSRRFADNPKDEYPRARIMRRKVIVHLGETNTGKTYRAIERLMQAKNGAYLAPLRVLALENFEKLNENGIPTNLITGEEELLVEGASHVCSTIEKLDIARRYDVCVIDEIQMIANTQRGQAWTRAVLGLCCPEIHICGAENARALLMRILEDCGDEVEVIEYKRKTPLEVVDKPFTLRQVERGDALVAFSKRGVLELAALYQSKGIRTSVIYGDLPPEVRRMQYRDFLSGESTVLVTTDAIGMGVNLPIRRIIFTDLVKFDGNERRLLTSQEVKQIAGRAGRQGIYDVGYVAAMEDGGADYLRECLETEDEPLEQAVLGPSEALLEIKELPLREKLALWSVTEEKLGYYRKMDVRDYLLVLDAIAPFKLPEPIAFRLMTLPFDVRSFELMQTLLDYVDAFFIRKKTTVPRPEETGFELQDLERYYQKLCLYYSFSKNFGAQFEPEWVYKEREDTSERMNKLLLRLEKSGKAARFLTT
ncbi:MAG TPA: RNA helicase [Papillibacter sp.]|nr:RNA helicase [Papillibacter sp.]